MNSEIYLPPETYQEAVLEFYMAKRGGVADFHEAYRYLDEEVTEMWEEMDDEVFSPLDLSQVNREKLAKEMADVLFTLYGVAISAGIDLDKAFDIVARDNLENKVRTESGKVGKREGYTPPSMEGALL